jgi:hypothetical protein
MAHASAAAILVEPGGHLSMPLAETLRRNADPDADWERSFGLRYHLAGTLCETNNPDDERYHYRTPKR